MGDILPASESVIERADVSSGKALADHRGSRWVRMFNTLGVLGKDPVLYALGGATLVVGLFTGRERLVRAAVGELASVLLADSIKLGIKKGVTRSRPQELIDEGTYRRHSGGSDFKRDKSFPSGHAARCMAAALGIARFHPGVGKLCLAAGALSAFSRILKGRHWPSDMIAGSVIGWGSEAMVGRLLRMPVAAQLTRKLCRKFG